MNDLQRYLAEEFVEDYAEGRLSRRRALKLVAAIVGGAAAARMLAACTQASPAPSASAPPAPVRIAYDDPEIVAGLAEFPGKDARLAGYLARPARSGEFPIVLVCHENRGLTRHIEDVTRRVAKAGYVGLAVDLLSREGGTDKLGYDAIPGLLGKAPPARFVQDFESGLEFAKSQPFARPRAGMVGFCFGGGVTWRVAAATPELRAAVPFYGLPVQDGEVPNIHAAVLAIYAGRDQRIDQHIAAIEAAMQKNGKVFREIVYPNVDHAFHNDTGGRYNAEAARAAWSETLAWFAEYI